MAFCLRLSYFNSIKVRLEREIAITEHLKQLFQFHKGAIRTGEHKAKSSAFAHFNSIKVRLELDGMNKTGRAIQFQFHKGAIRTSTIGITLCSLIIFQFHKGAIRTCTLFGNCVQLIYFNSIKVRLEPEKPMFSPASSIFQFHKGAIRTCLNKKPPLQKNRFQFHKGAIRTIGQITPHPPTDRPKTLFFCCLSLF